MAQTADRKPLEGGCRGLRGQSAAELRNAEGFAAELVRSCLLAAENVLIGARSNAKKSAGFCAA
jgi:hypothetical protein